MKPVGMLQVLGQTVTLQTDSTRRLWCPQITRQVFISTVFYLLFKLTRVPAPPMSAGHCSHRGNLAQTKHTAKPRGAAGHWGVRNGESRRDWREEQKIKILGFKVWLTEWDKIIKKVGMVSRGGKQFSLTCPILPLTFKLKWWITEIAMVKASVSSPVVSTVMHCHVQTAPSWDTKRLLIMDIILLQWSQWKAPKITSFPCRIICYFNAVNLQK